MNAQHDLPPEFYLPPEGDDALRAETRKLAKICVGFIVGLAVVVALTQDIVISLR